jgi:CRP-like cAMP-binding protein
MSPRASSATAHELSRAGLLATLPGEVLSRLAARMRREDLRPGTSPVADGESGDRFYVVLAGMLTATAASAPLRPGDHFGELVADRGLPGSTSVRALTPAVVASCDRATFDEVVRPLLDG